MQVLREFGEQVKRRAPELCRQGPDNQVRFGPWGIDSVYATNLIRIAVEGKHKLRTDGAVPDNRKAAFFDLYKLEHYVDSGEYSSGLFLWLTNEPAYLKQATGDSRDFSTHKGRVCEPGTVLSAHRSRNAMFFPSVLKRRYVFDWQAVDQHALWFTLMLWVD
jgi:hypothetical protein